MSAWLDFLYTALALLAFRLILFLWDSAVSSPHNNTNDIISPALQKLADLPMNLVVTNLQGTSLPTTPPCNWSFHTPTHVGAHSHTWMQHIHIHSLTRTLLMYSWHLMLVLLVVLLYSWEEWYGKFKSVLYSLTIIIINKMICDRLGSLNFPERLKSHTWFEFNKTAVPVSSPLLGICKGIKA